VDEVCIAFPALDALAAGYEVYVVADAIGGVMREDFGRLRALKS
jgi:nicotinamidase-related amidase